MLSTILVDNSVCLNPWKQFSTERPLELDTQQLKVLGEALLGKKPRVVSVGPSHSFADCWMMCMCGHHICKCLGKFMTIPLLPAWEDTGTLSFNYYLT